MKFLIAFISLCITVVSIFYILKDKKESFQPEKKIQTIQYIDVSGYHSETFSSDEILWELQISLMGKEKEELLSKKNERIKELTALVSSIGIDPNLLSFENYTLRKDWNWNQGKKTFSHYQLTQTIKIQFHSEKKSDLLSNGLIQINDIEIINVQYKIGDIEGKLNKIAAKAFEKAKDKADNLAKVSKKRIGTVISISESPLGNELMNFEGLLGGGRRAISSDMSNINAATKTKLESQVFVRFFLKD